jgi:hypothetical protein
LAWWYGSKRIQGINPKFTGVGHHVGRDQGYLRALGPDVFLAAFDVLSCDVRQTHVTS